ncbi:MAG: Fic/DOC family N-terminal domain-containing protein, partial [Cryomorphaceae bacterium]
MKPYKPQPLPLQNIEWEAFLELMGKANRYIARYDGLLQSIINPDVLLSPLRTREAVLSSKIEGTQATLEEVLEFEADALRSESKKGDIHEVINYRVALMLGRERMAQRPLSLNVIREIHEILMLGVRGESKDPGNFRRIQNWIGSPGCTMEQARFVPPTVPDMVEGLYDWEKYLHLDEKDVMVQLAIVHAQFEILHPFMDGNGRIGRILIPLFLFHKEIIHQPVFYMSQYLETNRQAYYDALKSITDSNNWT